MVTIQQGKGKVLSDSQTLERSLLECYSLSFQCPEA